jgi:hypothetical protein
MQSYARGGLTLDPCALSVLIKGLSMKSFKAVVGLAILSATGLADASTVTVTGGQGFQSQLASADAYRDAVEASIANSPLGGKQLDVFDGVNARNMFNLGTSNVDTAFKYTIDFGVAATQLGNWSFRFGVDFGGGGAVFLDGQALTFKGNDMWWSGNYNDPTQSFQINANFLSAGNHTLTVYGFEHCCDGTQQGQFKAANSNSFVNFGSQDGLVSVVPEPESMALMLAGLAALGVVSRRRRQG